MKINNDTYQKMIFIYFDNKEEINIFCRFFYTNDYFLRKYYKTLESYVDYISNAYRKCGNIHTDNIYHYRLALELNENIDKYRRKNKLANLDKLDESR